MKTIDIIKKDCTGCGYCSFVCPAGAIKIKESENNHFLYPFIDNVKCILCGKCFNECHLNNTLQVEQINKIVRAYYTSNKTIFNNSSSGGFFTLVANDILKDKGVVYGVNLDSKMNVKFVRITNINDLSLLNKSKYVQAYLDKEIYRNIKEDVSKDLKVLFVGVPCQVAAVSMMYKNRPKNLFLIDLICHGVPSNYLFKRYIEDEERKINGKINSFTFRYRDDNHQFGHLYSYIFTRKNKFYKTIGSSDTFPYYYLFLKYNIFRDSCYDCKYQSTSRFSDLTIADFHGYHLLNKNCKLKDNQISCVIANTKKGIDLLAKLENCFLDKNQYNIESVVKSNHSYANKNSMYKPCLDLLTHQDLKKTRRKYGDTGTIFKIKAFLKKILPIHHNNKNIIKSFKVTTKLKTNNKKQ